MSPIWLSKYLRCQLKGRTKHTRTHALYLLNARRNKGTQTFPPWAGCVYKRAKHTSRLAADDGECRFAPKHGRVLDFGSTNGR